MGTENIFKNIEIVLVQPQNPENIGLTARVIKNTNFKTLKLVEPNLSEKSFQVAKRARDILERSQVAVSLEQAVKNSDFVFATTRRKRKYRYIYNFDRIKEFIISAAQDKKISIVFGREDTGLSKEEIDSCDSVFYLAANSKFSSYNLSFSVGIVCYELFNTVSNLLDFSSLNLAKKKEIDTLFLYLRRYLRKSFTKKYSEGAHKNITRILTRTHLTKNEVALIKSILVKNI
jgi:tRNA/rRNA methyltransferase